MNSSIVSVGIDKSYVACEPWDDARSCPNPPFTCDDHTPRIVPGSTTTLTKLLALALSFLRCASPNHAIVQILLGTRNLHYRSSEPLASVRSEVRIKRHPQLALLLNLLLEQ